MSGKTQNGYKTVIKFVDIFTGMMSLLESMNERRDITTSSKTTQFLFALSAVVKLLQTHKRETLGLLEQL